jgi:DNA-binding response OmpR family regulator
LTAHAFSSARMQAREAGMVDYVTKPYMLDTLVHAIRQHARQLDTGDVPAPVNSSAHAHTHTHIGQEAPGNWTAARTSNDFAAMQQYFKAQPQLLDRLIGMLNRTLAEVEHELSRSLRERDMDNLAKVAHNIKGTALNLHTPELARLAVQTQEEARGHSPQAWASADDLLHCLHEFTSQAAHHQSP